MRRFVRYELKAISRYSSGAKRRRLSIVALIISPIVIFRPFLLLARTGYLGERFLLRYSLPRLLYFSSALIVGSVSVNLGRVSSKAQELIFSSALEDGELFFGLFLVALIETIPLVLPLTLLFLLVSGLYAFLLATILTLSGALVGFSLIAPSKNAKQTALRALIFAIPLFLGVRYPHLIRGFNEFLLGYLEPTGAFLYASLVALAVPAVAYGIRHARDAVIWQETIARTGRFQGGMSGLLKVYLIRYPALLLFIALPAVAEAFTIYTSRSMLTSLEGVLYILTSMVEVMPIVSAMMMLYGLSWELGRRDFRLASPSDRYPFRLWLRIVFVALAAYSLVPIMLYPRFGLQVVRMILRASSSATLASALGTLYASGACRPVKGTLNDAFRAPMGKQVFVALLIGIAGSIVSSLLIIAAFAFNLDVLASLALFLASFELFRVSERRFLERARKRFFETLMDLSPQVSMSERTFVMIKPDAVQRGLIGEIIRRLERVGLKLVAMKFIKMSKEQAEELYSVHKGKPFYESLINYVTSGPVVVMIREGPKAVEIVRKLIGATDPAKAAPGTIRGDYALTISYNVIHASDSQESYEREHRIFFKPEEIVERKRIDEERLY